MPVPPLHLESCGAAPCACCGDYGAAIIFCGATGGTYAITSTLPGDPPPPYFGYRGSVTITDPGPGLCGGCRVVFYGHFSFTGSEPWLRCTQTMANLITEFGADCVQIIGAGGGQPLSNMTGISHCEANGDIVIGLYSGDNAIADASYRFYRACAGCVKIAEGDFSDVPIFTHTEATVGVNPCCCKCCMPGEVAAGYFRQWNLEIYDSYYEDFEELSECCQDLITTIDGAGGKLLLELLDGYYPEGFPTGFGNTCVWADASGAVKIFASAGPFGETFGEIYFEMCGSADFASFIADPFAPGRDRLCRPYDMTNTMQSISLTTCGILFQITPVAASWRPCWASISDPPEMMTMAFGPFVGPLTLEQSRKVALLRSKVKQLTARKLERGKCAYLGDRTEYRADCPSGRMCKHECDHPNSKKRALHMVAVPGGNCQTCEHWSDTYDNNEDDGLALPGE